MAAPEQYASVRYVVDDVEAAIAFYTTHLGFTVNTHPAPAFADVVRGPLRLLLSGPASSGARATPSDVDRPGRNRIHLVVDDLDAEVAGLREAASLFVATWWSVPEVARSCSRIPRGTWWSSSRPEPSSGRRPPA